MVMEAADSVVEPGMEWDWEAEQMQADPLLELTGQPVPRSWALLAKVSPVCLTNTELYFVDGTGTPSAGVAEAALSDEARELLTLSLIPL